MRLAAIYNVWSDSVEHLEFSINSIRHVVEDVIVVVSKYSNSFVLDEFALDVCHKLHNDKLIDHLVVQEPMKHPSRHKSETLKRQKGIDYANKLGCSHFLLMDSDEYYREEEFREARRHIFINDIEASVVRLQTYFAHVTLYLEKKETYYVPFIHKLYHNTICGLGSYPRFVDPTRKIRSVKRVEEISALDMHHFSYCRNDISLKIQNSSAFRNIMPQENVILEDIRNARPGYFCKFYNCLLLETENEFKINLEKWQKTEKQT